MRRKFWERRADRCSTGRVIQPPKAKPGDVVAVVSPSWAAPAHYPDVHAQAMRRLTEVTGLVPREYPTTGRGSSPEVRARDLNEAFADPAVRAVVAVIGGDDQITVIPHLDPRLVIDDPKPFCGYSDNTNLLHWLWGHGVVGFHGGSTQVHLGAGPTVDACHAASLRAALVDGGRLDIVEPGWSEDFGPDWSTPEALTDVGHREPTEPWTWAGPAREVTGSTWGGCIEVIQWILAAGRFGADPAALDGAILLLEASELLIPAEEFGWILRSLGERGVLAAVDAVVVARSPASKPGRPSTPEGRADHRARQRDTALAVIQRYNPDAVVCIGVPFGHTRPQWILPYGGSMTVDGGRRQVSAEYGDPSEAT
ncbi:MAG: LD-carboxypeptidase [Actinomycetota bacterium]